MNRDHAVEVKYVVAMPASVRACQCLPRTVRVHRPEAELAGVSATVPAGPERRAKW